MSKYSDYLKTDYWKAVSLAVKKRAGYRCELCNSQHDLQAHHRCYDHRGKELEHLEDLTCLCRRCHAIFHGKETAAKEPAPQPVKRAKHVPNVNEIDHAWVEEHMPATNALTATGEPGVLLTHAKVKICRTRFGAFTNATIRAFGLSAPLTKGWVRRLAGMVVSLQDYRNALRGRYLYNTGRLE